MQIIFWYVFYGILSTFLVTPWYIKGLLKGKTIYKDYESYYGFSYKQKIYLYIATAIELISFFFIMKYVYNSGETFILPYTSHSILSFAFAFQMLNHIILFIDIDTSKFIKGVLLIVLYTSIIFIINYKAFPFSDTNMKKSLPNIMDYENTYNISEFIPDKNITREYEKDNLKYLFKNNTDNSSITILNSKDYTYSIISLNENLLGDEATIRKLYLSPNYYINYTGLTITTDNKVYKTYAIFDIKAFCYTPKFSHFVLKDCNSNDIITIK